MTLKLPVPVLDLPHWRVNIRPEFYEAEKLPLGSLIDLVGKTKVRLRGWDYPHLSSRETEIQYGANYVASWASFEGTEEYWRLYQSTQFVHLFAVQEYSRKSWHEKLQSAHQGHVWRSQNEPTEEAGYFDFVNFLYTVTEIFEFAARLCQAGVYSGTVKIDVKLTGIRGFVLSADFSRAWDRYVTSADPLGRTWALDAKELVADAAKASLDATEWFFERFGCRDLRPVLKHEQDLFRSRRR